VRTHWAKTSFPSHAEAYTTTSGGTNSTTQATTKTNTRETRHNDPNNSRRTVSHMNPYRINQHSGASHMMVVLGA